MRQRDRLVTGPNMADIDRGIESGVPKRILYQELSKIADNSRNKEGPVSKAVQEGLKRKAEEIHKAK